MEHFEEFSWSNFDQYWRLGSCVASSSGTTFMYLQRLTPNASCIVLRIVTTIPVKHYWYYSAILCIFNGLCSTKPPPLLRFSVSPIFFQCSFIPRISHSCIWYWTVSGHFSWFDLCDLVFLGVWGTSIVNESLSGVGMSGGEI